MSRVGSLASVAGWNMGCGQDHAAPLMLTYVRLSVRLTHSITLSTNPTVEDLELDKKNMNNTDHRKKNLANAVHDTTAAAAATTSHYSYFHESVSLTFLSVAVAGGAGESLSSSFTCTSLLTDMRHAIESFIAW